MLFTCHIHHNVKVSLSLYVGCVVKQRPEASAGTKTVCVATDHRALTTLYRSEADVKMKGVGIMEKLLTLVLCIAFLISLTDDVLLPFLFNLALT